MLATNPALLRRAYEAIESLDCCYRTEQVIDAMQVALRRFGVEFFCFNTFPKPDQRFEDVTLAIRVPDEWRKLYGEHYAQVDHTIGYCKRIDYPFKWQDAPYNAAREPLVTEFIDRATDFGLANGVWFPIPGPHGPIGGVWMGGSKADLIENNLPIVHLMALCAFQRMRRLPMSQNCDRTPLTPREREILAWAAQGKSSWETGEILGISKRTVDEHARTACRKLNAANRTQAVAVALHSRLIGL